MKWFLNLLTFCITFSPALGQSPAMGWKAPLVFPLEVELFSRTQPNGEPLRYKIRVLVSGKGEIGGVDCWNISHVASDDMPATFGHYGVSIAKQSLWPQRLTYLRTFKRVSEPVLATTLVGIGHPFNSLWLAGAGPTLRMNQKATEQVAWLTHFEKASFITGAPLGIPIEMMSLELTGKFTSKNPDRTLTVTHAKEDQFFVVEANFKIGEQSKVLVRQKWVEGEKWWHEYERYVDGELDLRARHVPTKLVNVMPPIDPTKPDLLYLRRDPKLQVVIAIESRGAKIADLFERIQTATGLLLTVDANLAEHQPNLGVVQPGPQGFRAADVMGIIERSQLENGRWVKTAKGYKLTGTSKVPAPVRLPEEGVPLGTPVRPERGKPWLYGGAAVLVVGLGIAVVVLMRRAKRLAARQAKG